MEAAAKAVHMARGARTLILQWLDSTARLEYTSQVDVAFTKKQRAGKG